MNNVGICSFMNYCYMIIVCITTKSFIIHHSSFIIYSMSLFHTNIFTPISVAKGQSLQRIDVFDIQGTKTITLDSHSSLVYLVVGSDVDIDVQIITK